MSGLSLEKLAEIAARIDTGESRSNVLHENALTAEEYLSAQQESLALIGKAALAGDFKLQRKYASEYQRCSAELSRERSAGEAMAPPAMAPPAMASPAMAPPAMASPAMASPAMAPPAMAPPAMAPPAMAAPAAVLPPIGVPAAYQKSESPPIAVAPPSPVQVSAQGWGGPARPSPEQAAPPPMMPPAMVPPAMVPPAMVPPAMAAPMSPAKSSSLVEGVDSASSGPARPPAVAQSPAVAQLPNFVAPPPLITPRDPVRAAPPTQAAEMPSMMGDIEPTWTGLVPSSSPPQPQAAPTPVPPSDGSEMAPVPVSRKVLDGFELRRPPQPEPHRLDAAQSAPNQVRPGLVQDVPVNKKHAATMVGSFASTGFGIPLPDEIRALARGAEAQRNQERTEVPDPAALPATVPRTEPPAIVAPVVGSALSSGTAPPESPPQPYPESPPQSPFGSPAMPPSPPRVRPLPDVFGGSSPLSSGGSLGSVPGQTPFSPQVPFGAVPHSSGMGQGALPPLAWSTPNPHGHGSGFPGGPSALPPLAGGAPPPQVGAPPLGLPQSQPLAGGSGPPPQAGLVGGPQSMPLSIQQLTCMKVELELNPAGAAQIYSSNGTDEGSFQRQLAQLESEIVVDEAKKSRFGQLLEYYRAVLASR